MKMIIEKIKLLLIIFFLAPYISMAGSFSIMMENDVIAQHDRYYTHGTRFIYSPDYIIDFPFYNNYNNESCFIMGQNMYTPSKITIKEKIIGDRPYSGYLYLGYLLEFYNQNNADLWEIDIGTSGEKSLAKETQSWIHQNIGSKIPLGWDNQVEDRFLATLVYYKKHKWRWKYGDIIVRGGGSPLSNLNSNLSAGSQFRLGFNIPNDFGFRRMEPNTRDNPKWSIYLIGDCDYRHVFYYYFLNEEVQNEYQIHMINDITEISAGIGLSLSNFSLQYMINNRSKEFTQQDHNNVFGSISLNFKF